jgi:hypothetical protein
LLAKRKHHLFKKGGVFVCAVVLSPGVEPGAPVPQTEILSIKLREQCRR